MILTAYKLSSVMCNNAVHLKIPVIPVHVQTIAGLLAEWCLRVNVSLSNIKIVSICGGAIKLSTFEDGVWAFTTRRLVARH